MNEEVINDLYNNAVSKGYKKSREEFISLLQSNDAVMNDMYTYVQSKGYKKGVDDFKDLIGATIEKPVAVESKKKEDTTGLPSGVGSSASSVSAPNDEIKALFKRYAEEAPLRKTFADRIIPPSPATTPEFKKELKEVSIRKEKEDAELYLAKLRAENEFDKLGEKPRVEQSKYLNEQLTQINKDLIGKGEEFVVPEMQYRFGNLGFKFEEAEGGRDYMNVTASNGKTTQISLDNFLESTSASEAFRLQKFIQDNTHVKGLFAFEKTLRDQDKVFNNQKEIDESLASINSEQANIMARKYEFVKIQSSLEAEKANLESVPEKQRNTPQYIAKVNDFISKADKFSSDLQAFEKDIESLKNKEQQLNESIGKYTEMKSQQGTWYGSALNAFANKSYYDMAKGLTGVTIDFIGEVISATGLPIMSQENYEKNFIEQAKKEGVNITEGEDFISITSRLSPETLANIENRVKDVGKKSVKGEVIGDLDKTSKMIMESSGVSPEYYQSVEETFVGGALLGALTSIPAMAGGPLTRTVLMGSQVLSGLDAEMSNDPAFADISENEKYLVKGPIAVAVATLESIGLSNLINQKGFLNGLVLKALGKVGKGASYKTFGEAVKNEIDSAVARGALTLGAGFLAEAETGALQEVADITIKEIYNMAKEKEMFDTPDSVVQFIERVGKASIQEGIGAGVISIPASVSAAYSGKGFLEMDDNQFMLFEKIANDSNIKKGFIATLKSRINSGEITAAEGKDILNNYTNSVGILNSLPNNLDIQGKKQAMNLLKERRELELQISGKDQALTVPQRNRITQINEQLTKLSEDAVQKQAAGQVPVQPEARVGQEVAQGEPQVEPQVVTQEGQKEIADENVILSGLRDGFKAVTRNSFDIRSDADVMQNIENRKSFTTSVTKNGKKYLVVGLKLKDVEATTSGRDGYSFAAIEDDGNLPSNAVDILTQKAVSNVSSVYPNIKTPTIDMFAPVEGKQEVIPASIQSDVDKINEARKKELDDFNGPLNQPYFIGDETGPTVEEFINQKYDTQIEELKAKAVPQVQVVPTKPIDVEGEVSLLEQFLIDEGLIPETEEAPKARLSTGVEKVDTRTSEEAVIAEMNKLAEQYPEEAKFGQVEPVGKSDVGEAVAQNPTPPEKKAPFLKRVLDKLGLTDEKQLYRTIESFADMPMMIGISDTLGSGTYKDAAGGDLEIDGGILFNFFRNTGLAWASVSQKLAENQVKQAKQVYESNKELFDRLWKEGALPEGHIPYAIVRMGDDALYSNEAIFRYLSPFIKTLPLENRKAALEVYKKQLIDVAKNQTASSFIFDLQEKIDDGSISTFEDIIGYLNDLTKSGVTESAAKSIQSLRNRLKDLKKGDDLFSRAVNSIEDVLSRKAPIRILEFIDKNNITTMDQFFDSIVKDSISRANGEPSSLSLPIRAIISSKIFSLNELKSRKPSSPIHKALLGETRNPLWDHIDKLTLPFIRDQISEPAMLKARQGDIVAVMGIDVREGSAGVEKAKHNNYGYSPKGTLISYIKNPTRAFDVFSELQAKAPKLIKPNKSGNYPSPESVVRQAGGTAYIDVAFRGAKLKSTGQTDLDIIIGKLRTAFPDVSVFTTKEEFENFLKQEGIRSRTDKNGNVIYGITKDGKVFLNPDNVSLRTPIHEFGHIWIDYLKSKASGKKGDDLLNRGLELVDGTPEYKEALIKYGNRELALEEALVELMATKGDTIISASKKNEFKNWLNALFKYIKEKFVTTKELFKDKEFQTKIDKMTLDEFINTSLADLFGMSQVSSKFKASEAKAASRARLDFNIDSIIRSARANGFSEESINIVLQKRGFTQEAIDAALAKAEPAAKKVEVTEEFAPGYNRVLNEIFGKDGIVDKSRRRGRSEEDTLKNAIDYLQQDTKVYENATDVQREAMVRDVNKRFKKRERRAPSAKKVLGQKKDVVTITVDLAKERDRIIKEQIKLAKEVTGDLNDKRAALADAIRMFEDGGVITTAQTKTIVNRISKVNLNNPIMVDRLLAYIEKVFDNANYADDMAELRKLQKQAKSRKHASMTNVVKQFTSINPENIPLDRIQDYKKALDFLNNLTPSYAAMNEVLDEMLSYQVTEEFDAVKTLEALQKKYKDIMANEVKNVEDYVNLIKDINSFKRRAFQLLQNEAIIQEDYDKLIEMVGKDQQTIEENYKDEISKIKKDLIDEIKNQRPKVSKDFSNVENDLIRKYLELSDADLQSLSPEELFILNDLLENISNGEIDVSRFAPIVSKAYTSSGLDPLAKQINKSKFNMSSERGVQELSEQESSFWEGLLGMGRAKAGALQKLIISPFNRAIGTYEKFNRDGYNEFLKLKNKYKIDRFDPLKKSKDMHKIGMLTTYLQEYMAQFDPKNKDIKDIGKRDWFKEILNSREMRDNYSSGKPSILKVIGLGKSELDIIKEIWDSLPKNKDGNVDPKAVYDSYMTNDGKFFTKNQKAFFDDVMAYKASEITPKQKFANELSGASFKEIPFHMMRVRLDKGKSQIAPTASSENNNVRIKAGTGKERVSEKVGAVMTNFEKLFISNIEQTGRDYFLSNTLNDINNTLSGVKKIVGDKKIELLNTISETLSEALKYEFDRTKSNFIFRNLLSARAAQTLLRPVRTAYELGATLISYPVRAKTLSGYKSLFGEQGNMKKLLEFTDSPLRLRDNINKAIDINDGRIEPQGRLTKMTAYLSGLPERTMMVTSWMPTFKSDFKNSTGIDFDMNKFNNSEAYREKYGKAIKDAAAAADSQTEKIIGPTTKAGQRREVRIAPRVLANIVGSEGTVSKNSATGQILGFFSNYPFRESTEFINGFKEAAEVLKDEGALSSLSQLQKPLGVALNVAAYSFLSSATYALGLMLLGDDEDEKRGDELLKNLITKEGLLDELKANAISLAGSKYAAGGKAIIQLAISILIESTDDENQKAKYKKLLKDSVFIDPLPVDKALGFKGEEEVAGAIGKYIPPFIIAYARYADLIGTKNEIKEIYDKVEKRGVGALTEDEGLKILALNTLFNGTQIVLNLFGTSIPEYNSIKTYMKKLKEDAGVSDVYKGEVSAKKKSSGGGSGAPKTINKTDMKKYFPDMYNELYGPGSATYEIDQEIKALEKQQRKMEEQIKKEIYGGR